MYVIEFDGFKAYFKVKALHLQMVKTEYSVSHIITYPSKELCSKMALGEGGVSLP